MCNFVRFEPCSEITLSLCNANKYMNKISTSTAEYELKNRNDAQNSHHAVTWVKPYTQLTAII